MDPIYQEIARKITRQDNKTLPIVLEKIATLEQAGILNELPLPFEELVEKTGINEETLMKDLQYLYERGLALRGRKRWSLVGNIILVKDLVASANAKYDDDELFELLHVMSLEDSDNLEERLKNGEKIPPVIEVMRVVPKWRSIENIPGVLPIEDMRQILNSPPIVVHNCPCHVVHGDRPCRDEVPIAICLAAGSTGRMYLERGAGKEITYDEAIALLDENGSVSARRHDRKLGPHAQYIVLMSRRLLRAVCESRANRADPGQGSVCQESLCHPG